MNNNGLNVITMICFRILKTFVLQAPRREAVVHRGCVEKAADGGHFHALASVLVTVKPNSGHKKMLY